MPFFTSFVGVVAAKLYGAVGARLSIFDFGKLRRAGK